MNRMKGLEIKRLKGNEIKNAIEDLARLRLTVFREYPYLYDGDMEYEKEYLNTYIKSEGSVLIVVKDADKIVGASTAIPLECETAECQKPFLEQKIPLQDIFYFGESVLLPPYRNRGVYRQFFDSREKEAQDYGRKIVAFCGVVRDKQDPRRPKDYRALDAVWRHFGYEPHPELVAHYEWKEMGALKSTIKPMMFWMKNIKD
jgi:GNAT superfamily N-acetyltransferase